MSAIIGSLIPKIEGFQPIPNAVMIPFMEAQSAALAFGFGLNYEYGKRKIRSMSNDEFNSLTSEDITNMSNAHTHIILSKFQEQVPKVMPMQTEIFKQYVIIEKLKVQQNFALAKWMVQYVKEVVDDTTAHLLGGHIHGGILEPYVTPPDKFINPITGKQGANATTTTPPPPPRQPTPATQQAIDKTVASITSTTTLLIWAGTPNSQTFNGYGQVRKYLTTLIKNTNPIARVLSLTKKGSATRSDKIPNATKITYWSARISGNTTLTPNQVIYFSIPSGY